jgi:hypothetical protein
MRCNLPQRGRALSSIGITTTDRTPKSVSSSTVAIGQKTSCLISGSALRPFSERSLANRTRSAHFLAALPIGDGQFTDDPLDTFGTKAVVRVPRLPKLMQYICRNGFEHHAAMNGSHCAAAVAEGLENYLGWDVYHHNAHEH